LEFSPQVPLDVNIRAGAGEGELDFTDLMIPELDVDVGAGDFVLRFDASNPVPMDHLTLDAGASKIEIIGAGNASPETMRVQGGVGDISIDLTGAWSRSAEITIRAGAGALALRLPADVGVEVETKGGLANVEAFGLRQMGGTYTNDAFGEAETELTISVLTGVGNVRLVEEGTLE
jgi:predicted membrane protein